VGLARLAAGAAEGEVGEVDVLSLTSRWTSHHSLASRPRTSPD